MKNNATAYLFWILIGEEKNSSTPPSFLFSSQFEQTPSLSPLFLSPSISISLYYRVRYLSNSFVDHLHSSYNHGQSLLSHSLLYCIEQILVFDLWFATTGDQVKFYRSDFALLYFDSQIFRLNIFCFGDLIFFFNVWSIDLDLFF